MANNEKVTGPHSGVFGVVSVLLLTAFTWGFIWFLHVKLWHDPINPLSPNETAVHAVATPHAPPTH
jgi:hypothetical protein